MSVGGRDAAGPGLRIVHGGTPDPATLAALTAALARLGATGARTATSRSSEPAWARAARLEATGGRRIGHPGELPPG